MRMVGITNQHLPIRPLITTRRQPQTAVVGGQGLHHFLPCLVVVYAVNQQMDLELPFRPTGEPALAENDRIPFRPRDQVYAMGRIQLGRQVYTLGNIPRQSTTDSEVLSSDATHLDCVMIYQRQFNLDALLPSMVSQVSLG